MDSKSCLEVGEPCCAVYSLPPELETTAGLCNSGDELAKQLGPGCKLVWHVRHGQSTGNVAKEAARLADKGTGEKIHEEEYKAGTAYIDAALTEKGLRQAEEARQAVAGWHEKPVLVVSSPLTRAIQTAAVVFQDLLRDGSAQLVIRPELREFWPDNNENMGRPLDELRACPGLQALSQWRIVEQALSTEATGDWHAQWDAQWARGSSGSWQEHILDPSRLRKFSVWLSHRPETKVAVVSHWGTINNMLNREPWAAERPTKEVSSAVPGRFPQSWPQDGVAKIFTMPNCGWVAVLMTPSVQRDVLLMPSVQSREAGCEIIEYVKGDAPVCKCRILGL